METRVNPSTLVWGKVEHNNRKFVKMLNKTKNELKEENLNRIKHLENNFNKKLSYKILNKDNEKKNKSKTSNSYQWKVTNTRVLN